MQIYAAGRFEDAMKLNEPRSHHGQVRHHGRTPEKSIQGLHHVPNRNILAFLNKFMVCFGGVGPCPSVGESVELSLAGLPGSLSKKDVVIRIGIERRVKIN